VSHLPRWALFGQRLGIGLLAGGDNQFLSLCLLILPSSIKPSFSQPMYFITFFTSFFVPPDFWGVARKEEGSFCMGIWLLAGVNRPQAEIHFFSPFPSTSLLTNEIQKELKSSHLPFC